MSKLEAIIDRLEEDKAMLKIGRQNLVVPIESLPEDVAEGAVLYLSFKTDAHAQDDKENMARAVLNEILKKDAP